MYGLSVIARLADECEKDTHYSHVIGTYHDLGMACVGPNPKLRQFVKIFIVISCTLVNVSVIIANTAAVTDFVVSHIADINPNLVKLYISIIYILVVITIVEPERIKIIT